MPLVQAGGAAPREPGVHQARVVGTTDVVYIGMAGERSRNVKVAPKGLRARIKGYERGRVLTNGLGRATVTRALRDHDFRQRIAATEIDSLFAFGKLVFEQAQLEIRWATTADRSSARALEDPLNDTHKGLWNDRKTIVKLEETK